MSWGLDLTIVVIYLLITLVVGLFYGRNVKNIKEYAIGKRNFTTLTLMMTITATIISGGFIFSGTTMAYQYGIIQTFTWSGLVFGALSYAYIIAPRIEPFLGRISMGEIMYDLYGKIGQCFTGISSYIVSLGFVAAQIKVMGLLFTYFIGYDDMFAVILSSLIVITYSAFGGIRSVTFTDVMQFLTIVVALPVLFIVVIKAAGGYTELFKKLEPHHLQLINDKVSFTHYFFLFIFFAIPNMTPSIAQRMLMAKDVSQIRYSFKISAGVIAVMVILSTILGFIAYAIDPHLEPNKALLLILDQYLPSGIKGIVIVGMLAIIMSTADSFMNVGSVSITHDVIAAIMGKNLRNSTELFISRLITFITGFAAVFLALKYTTVFNLVVAIQAYYTPIVGVPMLLGLFGFRSTTMPFLIGVCASLGTIVIWETWELEKILHFGNIIPAIIANGLFLVGSHYILNPKYSKKP